MSMFKFVCVLKLLFLTIRTAILGQVSLVKEILDLNGMNLFK